MNTRSCHAHRLGNEACDEACNNADCSFDGFDAATGTFGDCGLHKVEAACMPAMQASPTDYARAPAQVALAFTIGRLSLTVEQDGRMVAGTTLTSRMQWSSTQVQSSECPLPKMLSVNSGEAVSRASILNQAAELLFLPTLRIGGARG